MVVNTLLSRYILSKEVDSNSVESSQRREESEEKSQKRQSRKKIQVHDKVKKSQSSGGSKSRLATATGAEPSGGMRDEKLHTAVTRST